MVATAHGEQRDHSGSDRAVSMGEAARAVQMRGQVVPAAFGILPVILVVLFIARSFDGLVEPRLLHLWVAAMLLVPVGVAVLSAVQLLRRPDDAELIRVWHPVVVALGTWLNLCTIAGPWILLPHAGPPLRALMLMLWVWFLAIEVMADTTGRSLTTVGLVGLPLSISLFLLHDGAPYAVPLSVFMCLAGATLFVMATLMRRAETAALEAQWRSERIGVALRDALVTVAAERDARTRFLASASHDIQQPLAAASLFFEAAVEAPRGAARRAAVGGARSAFASMAALIEAILDHLRLDSGTVRARVEAVALGPLIAAVAAEFAPAAAEAGVRLIALPCCLSVTADSSLLRRALGNLVANALRHAGGSRVLIGVRRSAATATIWVIDDGRGVAAAERATLFEDYAQGAGAAPGGFGLGLASVRRALALMGGAAGHEARWTRGAAFWLQVPHAAPVALQRPLEALCEAA